MRFRNPSGEKERAIKTGYLSLAKECQEKQKEAEARLEQLQVKEEEKEESEKIRKSGRKSCSFHCIRLDQNSGTKTDGRRETRRLAQLEKNFINV